MLAGASCFVPLYKSILWTAASIHLAYVFLAGEYSWSFEHPETTSAIPRSRHSCNEGVVKLMPKWHYRRPDTDSSHDIRSTLKDADLLLLVLPTMLILFILLILLVPLPTFVPTSAGYGLILPIPSLRFSIKSSLRFHLHWRLIRSESL